MKNLLKTAALAAAPKMTLMARNPKKAALLKAAGWAMGRVRPQPKRSSMGRNAALGLGAAALAVPLGMMVGRMFRGGSEGGA